MPTEPTELVGMEMRILCLALSLQPFEKDTHHPWDASISRAKLAVTKLTRSQKEDMVMGTGWKGGPCTGHILPQQHIDFHGLCLQDSPMGVRFAANVTAFPSGVNVAATFDRNLMYEYGSAMGFEFRHVGANIQLGPMTNLFRAPAAGRNWEGPGGDPFLASISASQIVRGIQSHGVIATAKHFIANEQEHFRFDYSSNLDKKTLMEVYMQPFEACVRAGVASIMCSYNRLNQVYACANDELVNQILKGPEIDFKGFVMTDWDAHYSLLVSDMVMAGRDRNVSLALSVDDTEPQNIPESRLDDMVVRILSAYYHLGQDKGYPDIAFDSWEEKEKNVYNYDYRFKQHIPIARKLASASTILLKNEKGLLPLDASADGLVAVIGEDARRPHILNEFINRGGNDGTLAQGWGSGTAEFPYIVSPLEAIETHTRVISSVENNDLSKAKHVAASAKVALVFGNADSGEGGITVDGHEADRNDLKLWHNADELINAVASVNENTIVVLHTVGAVEMPWINHPNISAVVFALLPGQETGNALADVLFGKVNPSARLPFTIHNTITDYAAHVLYSSPDKIPQINYNEGLFFDYRHADKFGITPLFPFGHGLSYTSFKYSRLNVNRIDLHDSHSDLSIKLKVKNTGTFDGHEVIQLYVSFPEKALEPPKLLKGFDRVWVKSGETADVSLVLKKQDLRVWEGNGWTFVAGNYGIKVGASSRDLRLETVVQWG
ncbi:glycoside hydrolase family 3 protein [Obelidium mucronatum]|nr:glycoside hydrolase family 3 protein [Obelidium mucronatum]